MVNVNVWSTCRCTKEAVMYWPCYDALFMRTEGYALSLIHTHISNMKRINKHLLKEEYQSRIHSVIASFVCQFCLFHLVCSMILGRNQFSK